MSFQENKKSRIKKLKIEKKKSQSGKESEKSGCY